MRAVVPVFAAAVFGVVVGASFAEAGERVAGPAVCTASAGMKASTAAQDTINEHFAAGRRTDMALFWSDTHLVICAW